MCMDVSFQPWNRVFLTTEPSLQPAVPSVPLVFHRVGQVDPKVSLPASFSQHAEITGVSHQHLAHFSILKICVCVHACVFFLSFIFNWVCVFFLVCGDICM